MIGMVGGMGNGFIICGNLRNLPACASQWQAGLRMGLKGL